MNKFMGSLTLGAETVVEQVLVWVREEEDGVGRKSWHGTIELPGNYFDLLGPPANGSIGALFDMADGLVLDDGRAGRILIQSMDRRTIEFRGRGALVVPTGRDWWRDAPAHGSWRDRPPML